LNRGARDQAIQFDIHACTDVTGFGFLGHAWEMARASDVAFTLDVGSMPFLDGALELAAAGHLPGGARSNAEHLEGHVRWGGLGETHRDLLLDPQTSGGLLMACSPGDATALQATGVGHIVGQVTAGGPSLGF
ncbi:MAG: AIR synthase-related protein, partial [Myxococcota bacterium]|nr:AIR synthase-related protein [Myxococcota bacterium]